MTETKNPRLASIALLQQANMAFEPAHNIAQLLERTEAAARDGADFIMPTELAFTQYFGGIRDKGLQRWAVSVDGDDVQAFAAIAKRHGATIVLPVFHRSKADTYENVAFVLGPDGEPIEGQTLRGETVPFYSKTHLPDARLPDSGLAEPFHFEAGQHLPVFNTPLAKIGILICYDRRFPEAWRALALAGAEIIFMPSCVPVWSPAAAATTADTFVSELQTRSCENVLFVAACNRAGTEIIDGTESTFVGNSCLIGPGGGLIERLGPNDNERILQTIDLGLVEKVRERLPVLRDRRPDIYAGILG